MRPGSQKPEHSHALGPSRRRRAPDRNAVTRFTREIAPLILAGPPTVTGFADGRPRVQEVVAYWPALIDRQVVEGRITVETLPL